MCYWHLKYSVPFFTFIGDIIMSFFNALKSFIPAKTKTSVEPTTTTPVIPVVTKVVETAATTPPAPAEKVVEEVVAVTENKGSKIDEALTELEETIDYLLRRANYIAAEQHKLGEFNAPSLKAKSFLSRLGKGKKKVDALNSAVFSAKRRVARQMDKIHLQLSERVNVTDDAWTALASVENILRAIVEIKGSIASLEAAAGKGFFAESDEPDMVKFDKLAEAALNRAKGFRNKFGSADGIDASIVKRITGEHRWVHVAIVKAGGEESDVISAALAAVKLSLQQGGNPVSAVRSYYVLQAKYPQYFLGIKPAETKTEPVEEAVEATA